MENGTDDRSDNHTDDNGGIHAERGAVKTELKRLMPNDGNEMHDRDGTHICSMGKMIIDGKRRIYGLDFGNMSLIKNRSFMYRGGELVITDDS